MSPHTVTPNTVMGLQVFLVIMSSSMLVVYGIVLMDRLLYETLVEKGSMQQKVGDTEEVGEKCIEIQIKA